MIEPTTSLAQQVTAFLESPYKPFLIFLSFVPWAWLISSKLARDARFFHLNPTTWNGIHLAAGAIALAAMLFIPIFWVGWPVGIVVLLTPLIVYWQYRNPRVPSAERFELSSLRPGESRGVRRQAKARRDAAIRFTDAEGGAHDVPLKDDPAYGVHMLVEDLLGPAVEARTSRLEILAGRNGAGVSQLIDGVPYKREPLPAESGVQVIDYLKGLAGLDVQDRRRRQSGEFRMEGPTGRTDLVAVTAGSSTGQVLRVLFDRAKRLNRPFDQLGLLPSQAKALASLLEPHDRHGIVLVGAPSGQGLTTTMYSLVGRHDAFTSNIKTIEREIELRLDGIDHVQWDASNPDVEYASQLQSILRRDPDIVMLDLIKDQETARTVVEPGMKGPLLYVPQQAASVVEQIRAWVKAVGDIQRATKALRAVMNQRLLRTLCPNCKQAFQPTAEHLKKLNLPPNKVRQLFQASGKVEIKNRIESCPVCGGRGYLGQTGIFEVFLVDDAARKHLAAGDMKAARDHARRNKMAYLQEAALAKVAAGETTIEEAVRVTAPPKNASGESPAAPAALAS